MTFVLFDVGANHGTDSLPQTQADSLVRTFAFEPTPELAELLRRESKIFSDRYTVHEFALSDFDGTAKFNVSSHTDWGVSSLLEFNPDRHRTWERRGDLYFDRSVEVQVRRFDTWFEQTKPPINKIDFFHCDTQGSDLKVLRGMGEYFGLIVEGVIECPQSEDVKLYVGQHSREEAEDFLSDRGYEIFGIHAQQNEDNVYFRKKK